MSIDIDATYRDGAIHPATPLSLPNDTPVRVSIVPQTRRPQAPRFTSEELTALLKGFSLSAPSLPDDFSRADIYSDRD